MIELANGIRGGFFRLEQHRPEASGPAVRALADLRCHDGSASPEILDQVN